MKTAVITGGNSGIGKAIALGLAKKNYRIIIHGRDAQKTAEAAEEIKAGSRNAHVDYIVEDVSVISGMKKLAAAVKAKTDCIDVLVLSTGIILPQHVTTEDGLEKGFAVQYLSRFATTQLLMNELRKGHARIVMVGAPLLNGAKIFFDDISMKKNFTMMKALAQEMLANHLFVQEFARRNPGNEIVINMGHPGIARTGITRHSNFLFRLFVQMVGISPQKSAANFIYLADNTEAKFSGYFLRKTGNPKVKDKISLNAADAERLWEMSTGLIK